VTQQVIADRLGVAQSVISELLARVHAAPVQQVMPEPAEADDEGESVQPSTVEPVAVEPDGEKVEGEELGRAAFAGSARIATGAYRCRYAGAMPLYGYLHGRTLRAGVHLPGVLAQLRQVIGPHAPILLGFDRGGAYPSAFTTCRNAGTDWVTYRRAPLLATIAAPARATTTAPACRCR